MSLDGERNLVYDTYNSVDCKSDVGGLVIRWMLWCGCSAVLRRDVTTYADMHFICFTEEKAYAIGLVLIE